MLTDKECEVIVTLPLRGREKDEIIRTSEITAALLKFLKEIKADEKLGYFVAVTELLRIGQGLKHYHIHFPVKFRCRTFIPQSGDVMIGTVESFSRDAAWLKCGPVTFINLPERYMPGYSYVEGEKPFFLSNDQSRIDYNIPIRFKVLAARWLRVEGIVYGSILATINEPSLGPIQSAGSDAEEFESLCAE